jgi:phosphate transport system permease protein
LALRYTTDLLNGVPSIVIGIVVYGMLVLRSHHFSTFAGGVALRIMMIPIAVTPDCHAAGDDLQLRDLAL